MRMSRYKPLLCFLFACIVLIAIAFLSLREHIVTFFVCRQNPPVEFTAKSHVVRLTRGPTCPEDLQTSNSEAYFNKKDCCLFALDKALTELCGIVNETTLGNKKFSNPQCDCIDFMACKTVALTAASADHYTELQDGIASVQNFHPDMKILVYDLGLWPCQGEHLNSLRNVEVILYPYYLFPPHVRNLHNYAWKSLGISETLKIYEIVYWFDASLRLVAAMTDKLLFDIQAFPFRGEMMAFFYDGLYTYDSTYEWFGVTRAQMGKINQVQGGIQTVRRSPYLYKHIYNELLSCLLDTSCIEPPGHYLYCRNDPPVPDDIKPEDIPNLGCFRYDQSALTIVLGKQYNLTMNTPFVSSMSHTIGVHREETHCFPMFKKE